MSDPAAAEAGPARAWAWVDHLRAGGTTPWAEWSASSGQLSQQPESQPASPRRRGRYLPGAQQLELLRRLNEAGRPSPALAQRVCEASAPGRGRPDLELVGAAPPSRFGPAPVDPADLPDDELVRVATLLLAEDTVAAGTPEPPAPGRPRPWRRRYRLVGDAWLADPVREELARRGRPPGGRQPVVHVVGTDLATMTAHAWLGRCFGHGAPPWRDWLDHLAAADRVPPRADLLAAVTAWADRVGKQRVRVVLDADQLPGLLGVRRTLPGPPQVSADGAELARRTAPALGLLVVPARREELLRRGLLPRVAGQAGAPPRVPEEHLPWLVRRAERMRDELLDGGYAVVGDPQRLVPPAETGRGEPTDAGVLALALRLLLAGDTPPAGAATRHGHAGATQKEVAG